MIRPALAAALSTVVLLAISTESRGADPAALNAEQQAARDAFMEDLKDSLDWVKEQCGIAVPVVTDFQNFDPSKEPPKEPGQPGPRFLRSLNCQHVFEAVAKDCKKTKTAVVKSVSCVFAGYQSRKAGDDTDTFFHRNLAFDAATGQLTVHQSTGTVYGNVDQNVRATLHADTGGSRFNGSPCTEDAQCKSNLCAESKCVACGKTNRCHQGLVCGTKGDCALAVSSSSGSAPSSGDTGSAKAPPKPKEGKGLGKSCKSTSECRSGLTCKPVSKSRSTCR